MVTGITMVLSDNTQIKDETSEPLMAHDMEANFSWRTEMEVNVVAAFTVETKVAQEASMLTLATDLQMTTVIATGAVGGGTMMTIDNDSRLRHNNLGIFPTMKAVRVTLSAVHPIRTDANSKNRRIFEIMDNPAH